MNKAFVREPEDDGGRCPRCGSLGLSVDRGTVRAQLPEAASAVFAGSAFHSLGIQGLERFGDSSGRIEDV